MKVLSIGSDRKLFEEGSAVQARAIEYAALFEELHIVVFSTGIFAKTQIASNAWVYSTNSWSRWLYILDAIRIGKRIIHDSKFVIRDSVLTAQDPFECGLAAYKIARFFKLPLHVQIHTDFLSPYFASLSILNRIRVRIARRVLPYAAAIRVVSERIKNSLSKVNCQLSKVSVLPIFTDLEKFQKTESAFDLKSRYPNWHFIILVVARLSPEKNIGFAFTLLGELLKKYPKIGMVVVGDGPLEESLKSQVKSLRLEENVVFEGRQEDTVSYYKTANLFLQSSLYEGFGLALLEAVAAGCPSVSSDVGIAPELLNRKEYSFVCPVNNLGCFVETTSKLIENNQLREFFSLDIAPIAVASFLISKQIYLEAYKTSLEGCLPASQ